MNQIIDLLASFVDAVATGTLILGGLVLMSILGGATLILFGRKRT